MSDTENEIFEYSEDLSNAEAPSPLPEGDYPFEVRSAAIKVSNSSGNKYLSLGIYFAPESYPADYTEGAPDGTTLSYNRLTYDDSTRGRYRMRKALEALGAKLSNKVDPNDLVGLTGTATIAHRDYEGMPQADVTKITAKA